MTEAKTKQQEALEAELEAVFKSLHDTLDIAKDMLKNEWEWRTAMVLMVGVSAGVTDITNQVMEWIREREASSD